MDNFLNIDQAIQIAFIAFLSTAFGAIVGAWVSIRTTRETLKHQADLALRNMQSNSSIEKEARKTAYLLDSFREFKVLQENYDNALMELMSGTAQVKHDPDFPPVKFTDKVLEMARIIDRIAVMLCIVPDADIAKGGSQLMQQSNQLLRMITPEIFDVDEVNLKCRKLSTDILSVGIKMGNLINKIMTSEID